MHTRHDRQKILTQAQAMRMQARLTRQRAFRARQEAAMTCTQAQLTELRGLMPGATAMTYEITAVILTQRGLLDVPQRSRGTTVTP
jgi:hypothetical protein